MGNRGFYRCAKWERIKLLYSVYLCKGHRVRSKERGNESSLQKRVWGNGGSAFVKILSFLLANVVERLSELLNLHCPMTPGMVNDSEAK